MIAGRKATVEVCASCTLKFPHERLATFSTSFGTEGVGSRRPRLRQGAKERTIRHKKRDQPLRRQSTRRQELTHPPVRRKPLVRATPPSG